MFWGKLACFHQEWFFWGMLTRTKFVAGDIIFITRPQKVKPWYMYRKISGGHGPILTLQQLSIFWMKFYFVMSTLWMQYFFMKLAQYNICWALWILMARCFSTGALVATVLSMHPCISRYLWIKLPIYNNFRLSHQHPAVPPVRIKI